MGLLYLLKGCRGVSDGDSGLRWREGVLDGDSRLR